MGTQALGELRQQRDQLVRANDNLDAVDDTMYVADGGCFQCASDDGVRVPSLLYRRSNRKVIRGMQRRTVTNKLILGCIIIVLLLAILGVLYFVWLRPLTDGSHTAAGAKSAAKTAAAVTLPQLRMRPRQ